MTAGADDQVTCALNSEPRLDVRPGLPENVAPFRVLGLPGEGGMGRVYRARKRSPPCEVALKAAGLPTRGGLERFEREIELLAQLEHPGIARPYATGVDERSGLPWLSMELVHGEDLGRCSARVQPGRESSISVLLSICTAVQYAHGRGVLPRDLKPSNVFVASDASTRVLDFGGDLGEVAMKAIGPERERCYASVDALAANAARSSQPLQPLVRARVLGVLGSAQASLGDAGAALESLDSARTLLGDIAGMPAKEWRAIESVLVNTQSLGARYQLVEKLPSWEFFESAVRHWSVPPPDTSIAYALALSPRPSLAELV